MKRFIFDDTLNKYKKYCNKCNEYKVESDFYTGDSWCKKCLSKIKRIRTKKTNKDEIYYERKSNRDRIKNTIELLKQKKN